MIRLQRRSRSAGILVALLAIAHPARLPAAEPPPFALIRADEDYRYLRNPDAAKSWEDGIKYVPLDSSGQSFLSLGGEVRERVDVFDAPRFGIGQRSDAYVLQRVLLHGDLHVTDRFRIFAEFGKHDAYDKNRPLGPTDEDGADLQVGFLDVVPDPDEHLTLRAGRQELQFNPLQRFVSVREGPNIRQSFDGGRAFWRDGPLKVDVFATRPVQIKPGAFDDTADHTLRFYGGNLETALDAATIVEGYVFEYDHDRVRYGSNSGNERRTSIGLRLAGRREAWDYDAEGIGQLGSMSGHDIAAWAGSADGGYTLAADWAPRLGLRFDAGSGGSNGRTGMVGTFQPMFPKGAYFNETALTSWSNLIAIRPSLRVQPMPTVSLEASVLLRWRQNPADAVYVQPSTPIAATLGNRAREVGQAYELDATWKATRNLSFEMQFVHQAAGPAITKAGGHDTDFGMLITQLRF